MKKSVTFCKYNLKKWKKDEKYEKTSRLKKETETVIIPFIVLQIISALKNASMAGFIKAEELNKILDRIDNHKGIRK